MSASFASRPPFAGIATLCLLAFCLLAFPGCEKPDPIVTYTIPTRVPDQLLAGKDRMLAVMLPQENDVWFFKVTGPELAIASVESAFQKFVSEVSFVGDGPDLRELPAGWRRSGEKPMRYASINIDTPSKQLDMSVSKLSRQEDWDTQVKMNVNRWRGQVGLEPSDEKWAGATAIEIASAEGGGVWVDLVGQSSGDSMSPPFARSPPAGGGPFSAGSAMPPGHPPVAAAETSAANPTPEAAAEPDERLKFDRPEGWRDGRMSSMRMAAFNVGPEDAPAEITVIQAGGDLKGNVKRWMGQVRQAEVTDDEVDQALADAMEVEVSGLQGHRYVLIGDEETIDATIVPLSPAQENGDNEDGSMSLFIKMKGPAKTVADQSGAVEAFLKSMKLNLK
jgi:hypothetical protein